MLSSIGDGLLQFLSSNTQAERLVTKTPDVSNISNFSTLFPEAYLIVLVRDGRAVAESRVNTFHESYDVAMHKWLVGAKTIISFQQQVHHRPSRYLLVKYEDLWSDAESELRRIFQFCTLDADLYDYSAAKDQPVWGSSEYKVEGQTEIHWSPIAKAADFNPTDRWKHWNRRRHELFNHLAREPMERFGYELRHFNGHELVWYLLIRGLSFRSKLSYLSHRALRITKRGVKRLLGNSWAVQIRRALLFGKSR